MKNQKERKSAAQQAFKVNQSVETLFVTADCVSFSQKNSAKNHAFSLEDDSILEVKRSGNSAPSKKEKKNKDGAPRINPSELTADQLEKRLTDDFTIKEKKAIAEEFNFDAADFKGLKDAEISAKLLELSTEAQKEILIQKLEDKL